MRLLLRQFLGQYDDASRRPDDRVSHECPSVLHQWCQLVWLRQTRCRLSILFAYRPKAPPFADEANCKNGKLLEGRLAEQFLSHCSQPSRKFQHGKLCASGRCVGVHRAMALIGNRQATSWGKSGPVETGLTGPAATALS